MRAKPVLHSTVKIDLIAEDAHLSERVNMLCEEQSINLIARPYQENLNA